MYVWAFTTVHSKKLKQNIATSKITVTLKTKEVIFREIAWRPKASDLALSRHRVIYERLGVKWSFFVVKDCSVAKFAAFADKGNRSQKFFVFTFLFFELSGRFKWSKNNIPQKFTDTAPIQYTLISCRNNLTFLCIYTLL